MESFICNLYLLISLRNNCYFFFNNWYTPLRGNIKKLFKWIKDQLAQITPPIFMDGLTITIGQSGLV